MTNEISAAQVLELLSAGTWRIYDHPVTKAEISGGMLVLSDKTEIITLVKTDRLSFYVNTGDYPHTIIIFGPQMVPNFCCGRLNRDQPNVERFTVRLVLTNTQR